MSSESDDLKVLYSNRFGQEGEPRTDLWRVLCSDFFQRWIPRDSTVLDVAAGHCEFINNISAGTKARGRSQPGRRPVRGARC